jgi:hypothetical protein
LIKIKRVLLVSIVFLSIIYVQVAPGTHEITVDNTVVISNETDESFFKRFFSFSERIVSWLGNSEGKDSSWISEGKEPHHYWRTRCRNSGGYCQDHFIMGRRSLFP